MQQQVVIADGSTKGMGWIRDYPSIRDFTPETDDEFVREVSPGAETSEHTGDQTVKVAPPARLLAKTGAPKAAKSPPAGPIDLRQWCAPIEDQGPLGACTAFAGVAMFEYFQNKAFGKHVDHSQRFLYKVTRRLGGFTGDSGAYLRTTMGAMTFFGAPPWRYWRYDVENFDREPPAFCYAFAQNFQALSYYRLDPPGTQPAALLDTIKGHLASQLPSMFGFTCFQSLDLVGADGEIPYPKTNEDIVGGHAVMAVGYDNNRKIEHPGGGPTTKGAFRIRNSWGKEWGEDGYGWLPYRYVTEGLADDWWVLLKEEWVDTGQFKT